MAKKCPLMKKNCIGNECAWSVTVRGNNPQTGEDINSTDCAAALLPMLMIENTQIANATTRAVEQMRDIFLGAQRKQTPEIEQ